MISEFLSAQKDLLAQAEERLEQYQVPGAGGLVTWPRTRWTATRA